MRGIHGMLWDKMGLDGIFGSNYQNLDIGIWTLVIYLAFGIWILEFVIWNLFGA
jgi:hypothetical protein